ncbi:MFS transporter [Saccharothrix violaceirubra]|uniref:MFS family permease n=1 Tax=Saccharothrix violaceirubra TaxID=413306 RepID=A0A7W7SYP3_9PSEU|nr:MFS transporter [Saccharothrix violaceirubra]MBB4963384.1 MFS family permease [Saccharothrix violaceirubra]
MNTGSWGALLRPPHLAVLTVLAGGTALHAINIYLVTAMLPSVVADIGGLRYYAWSTTLFMFASVVSSALVPRCLSRLGPRGSYRFAFVAFGIGTLVCALAPDMAVLLVGRTVQGLGGGLLVGLSYAMIGATLPPALWTRAAGVLSAMWGVGTLVGPALGGAFAQLGQWRTAFGVLAGCTLGLMLLLRSTMPDDRTRTATPVPVANLALIAAAVLLVSATSLSHEALVNVAGVVGAIVLLGVFVHRERTRAPRVLPRKAFTSGSALIPLYGTLVVLVLASTTEIFVPFFGGHLGGLGPLAAGFLGAALAAGWTVGSMVSAGLTGRARALVGVAPLVSALGLTGLSLTSWSAAPAALVLVWAVLLFVTGSGVGIAWPHMTATAMNSGDTPREQDTAAASLTTVQLVATSLGAALAGTVTNLTGVDGNAADIANSSRWLYGVFGAIVLTGVLFAHRTVSSRTTEPV